MSSMTEEIARMACIGIGATAVLDLWIAFLARAGVPTLDLALIGRWAGHLANGRWSHDAIARAAPVKHERALGWLVHYAVGIAFAVVLVAICGAGWMRDPSLVPALCVGVGSVIAPWLVLQPAMGAGIAASRTAAPARNRTRSLVNHAVFGAGLYVAAVLIGRIVA